MKFFTKQRVAVLSALAAVIAALLMVIAFAEIIPGPSAGVPVSALPQHETVRDARVGLAAHVEWETNFGGSGNERPVSCYTLGGKPYIFGDTSSSDLDFGGGGVFASRLSGYGKTEKFATYAAAGSTLHSATLLENGFILTVNGETQSAVMINPELETVATLTLTPPENCGYSIVDVGHYDGKLYVFRQSENAQPAHVVCDILSVTGSFISQKVFKQTLDLAYRGFFPGQTLVTTFEESGTASGCATFAEWTASGNISYNRTVTASPYKTLDVYPSPHGWLALTTANGETRISVISATYSLIRNVIVDFAGVRSGEFFYSASASAYYVAVYVEGEINGVFSLGDGITQATRINLPAYSSMYFYGTSTADVLALVSGESITLAVITGGAAKLTAITDYAKSPLIMRSDNNWFITFAAKEKAAIVGNNYGGYDVAVAKLKF